MSVIVVTGSCGLVGAETCRHFADDGFEVVGIDNDMRRVFFGDEASTRWQRAELERHSRTYHHNEIDIRDGDAIGHVFSRYGRAISLVVHTAAQPSHDWAARDPTVDFGVNANGTLTLLEATRAWCPDAVFILTSTNKVYGDTPNQLPLTEHATRFEVTSHHPYAEHGIDETMSLDQSKHSLFGASKLAADVLTQEYGRYFGMKTGVFRGGCLTGPGHSGAQLHGFLSYLVRCAITGRPYTIFGYKGKQVRDNIHSADLIAAFDCFFRKPRPGAVYNIGGGRVSNCSVLEAVELCEDCARARTALQYVDANRNGDHIWWISDLRRFQADYPLWRITYTVPEIIQELADVQRSRLRA